MQGLNNLSKSWIGIILEWSNFSPRGRSRVKGFYYNSAKVLIFWSTTDMMSKFEQICNVHEWETKMNCASFSPTLNIW